MSPIFLADRTRSRLLCLLCVLALPAASHDAPAVPMTAGKLFGSGDVLQVEYSNSGESLAVLTTAGLKIYEAESGRILQSIERAGWRVRAFSWSPDGKRLALAGGDIEIWDSQKARAERTLRANPDGDPFDDVHWSPDGVSIAAGSGDRVVVFEVATGRQTAELRLDAAPGALRSVDGIAWAPDSGQIAVLSGAWNTRKATLWDARTLSRLRAISLSHQKPPRCDAESCSPDRLDKESKISWSPDGQELAVYCPESGLSIWSVRTGSLRRRVHAKEPVISLSWSRDGQLLRVGSYRRFDFWRRDTGAISYSLHPRFDRPSDSLYVSTVSTDGERIAASIFKRGVVVTWRGREATHRRIVIGNPVDEIALSSDQRTAIGGSSWGQTMMWNLESGDEVAHFPTVRHSDGSWSPDGRLLAEANGEGLQIRRLEDGRISASFPLPKSDLPYTEPLWSPNGARVLVRNTRGDVVVSLDSGAIESLPSAKGLAVWSRDATLVWVPNFKNYHCLQSPDLQYVAVVDHPRLRVFQIQADGGSREISTLEGSAAAWAPDSRRIAYISSANANQVDVWNVAEARIIERLQAGEARNLIALSWHDRLVAVERLGSAVRLWWGP